MRDLYESQRAMRNMRKAAMQRGVVAILDVGTSKIACLVLRFDEAQSLEAEGIGSMAGQSSFRVIGAATTRSRGVRFGEVDAMQETERAIRTAVNAAQKMAQVRVDHVIACLSGARPRSYGLDGALDIEGGMVSEQDIAQVMASCDVPDYGEDREVLHAQPVNFALDNRSGMADPRGEMIEIGGNTGDWEHDRRTVSRAELIGIMRPRVEEILEEVRVRLDAAGFEHLPSQKIVLTGGASQIPGLDGLASKILGQQVRLGRPLRVQGLPQAATGPAFASAVGMTLFAANPQDEWWDFEIPADRHASKSFRRAVKWFKDNW